MSRCAIVPDQTSMDWTEPHSTRLTPKSSLLRRLPLHFLGERRSIGSRLHSLKHPGLQGEEVGSMGEAFLTEVTISYRYTLLGPWTLHLLTAGHPCPLWRTLALAHQANFTVRVGSMIPMPFQQLDNPKASKGLHSTQCVSVNGTHVHPHSLPHLPQQQVLSALPSKAPHSQLIHSTHTTLPAWSPSPLTGFPQ